MEQRENVLTLHVKSVSDQCIRFVHTRITGVVWYNIPFGSKTLPTIPYFSKPACFRWDGKTLSLDVNGCSFTWGNLRDGDYLQIYHSTPSDSYDCTTNNVSAQTENKLLPLSFKFRSILAKLQERLLECIESDDPEQFGKWMTQLKKML